MTGPLDPTARPRIGLVWDGATDSATAVALRTLELSLLRWLPAARLSLLCTGGAVSPAPHAVRNVGWVQVGDDQQQSRLTGDHDLLLLLGLPVRTETALVAAMGSVGARAVAVAAPLLTVCELAWGAQQPWFAHNRLGLLRALGWLPGDPRTPHVVVDAVPTLAAQVIDLLEADPDLQAVVLGSTTQTREAPIELVGSLPAGRGWSVGGAAGADEVVAAVGSARLHIGSDPMPGAVLAGVGGPSAAAMALTAWLSEAARSGVEVWDTRGRPGDTPDARASRRAGTERAALQCELLVARRAAAEATTQLEAVVGSRSWRFTAPLRAGRRHLGT